ncbi:hypothetical protein [Sinorhizobium americanum]|uniref:Uncharacterized protein n=1 Tax=Sinorhizobium americanum TaxID=194963 RepID=A0A4R2B888_9HYPH|nr:hypothetical protein [Sinorhizobium americanum]TCN22776.1 hypothetical protein EV184_12321 [Sinorhizobium americanum]
MNTGKMIKLIEDRRRDIRNYLSPESGISDREIVIALLNRLEGPQGMDALEEDLVRRALPDDFATAEPSGLHTNEGRLKIILQAKTCL